MDGQVVINWIHLGIACAVFIISGVTAVWRVSWVVKGLIDDVKANFHAQIEILEKDTEQKRGRLYQRFDEYKDHVEGDILKEYVRKDIFAQHDTHTCQRMDRLEVMIGEGNKKMDELLRLAVSRQE